MGIHIPCLFVHMGRTCIGWMVLVRWMGMGIYLIGISQRKSKRHDIVSGICIGWKWVIA